MSRGATDTAVATSAASSHHAEGPLWDDRIGRLVWVDQYRGLVQIARPGPETDELEIERTFELGCAVGAIVPAGAPGDGWFLACAAGFAHLSGDGALQLLAQPEQGLAGRNRMNDGKCDPRGRFWAGSMARDKRAGAGTLYRLDGDLSVHVVLSEVTISNGLAWSPDGSRMYYIDTPTHRIDRFDVDRHGAITRRRALALLDERDGVPDGLCIDDEGCLWVALWGGSAVRRHSPRGEVLATVSVEAPQVSSCCFGGVDRRTLYITTSQEDMGPAERSRHPLSGRVFAVRLPVGGPPAARFGGDAGVGG